MNYNQKLVEADRKEYTMSCEVVSKPVAKLVGANGNIFNLVGIASRSLKTAGQKDKATEMSNRVMSSGSYEEALSIIMEYVEVE